MNNQYNYMIPSYIYDIIYKQYGNNNWNIYSAFNYNFISGIMNKQTLSKLCKREIISDNDILNVNIRIYNYLYEISYNKKDDREYIILNYIDLNMDEKILYDFLRNSYFTNIGYPRCEQIIS
jgi:hypothetical protein